MYEIKFKACLLEKSNNEMCLIRMTSISNDKIKRREKAVVENQKTNDVFDVKLPTSIIT
jgi:hypothetical protein